MLHNRDFPDHIVAGGVDTRNVIDHYKCWDTEAILSDLQQRRSPLHVVAENFAHDLNIGTLVRNANAFNVSDVTMLGRRKWDKRGAVGTYHYTPYHHEADAEAFYRDLQARSAPLVVVDNIPGATPLSRFKWPTGPTWVVFGQEAIGVSNLALSYADSCISVPQLGSVRSMNVGACSAIVLYDYSLRTGRLPS